MTNPSTGFGFRPIRRLDGAAWTGSGSPRTILATYATAIYRGDVVSTDSSGYIIRGTTQSAPISGIFWGCEYYDNTVRQWLYQPYYPAAAPSTLNIKAFVVDDPNVIFQARLSGAITNFHPGVNANYTTTTPTNVGTQGLSVESIDSANMDTTNTRPFRCIKYDPSVDNDAASSYAKVWVILNNSDFRQLTGF